MTDATTQGARKRHFATADYAALEYAADTLGKSVHELAEEHGYTRSAVRGWQERKEIPLVLNLALSNKIELEQQQRKFVVIGFLKPHVTTEFAHELMQTIFDNYTAAK